MQMTTNPELYFVFFYAVRFCFISLLLKIDIQSDAYALFLRKRKIDFAKCANSLVQLKLIWHINVSSKLSFALIVSVAWE